jgi:hypothetical protein
MVNHELVRNIMKFTCLILVAFLSIMGCANAASLEDVSSKITRVERPGVGSPGPFIIVYLVSEEGVTETFQILLDAIKWQVRHGDHNYQQFLFHIGIPVQDKWGNTGIGEAMMISFAADRTKFEAMDWDKMTPKDLIKISFARDIAREGYEWGHEFCGSDPNTAHQISFCAEFINCYYCRP